MAADVILVIISFHIISLSPITDGHSLLNSTFKFIVLAIGKTVLLL